MYYMLILELITNKIIEGKLRIPKTKEVYPVELTEEVREEFKRILSDIPTVINKNIPPKPSKKPYCKNCAYLHFCWI